MLYGRGGALADVTQSQRVHASKAAREYTFCTGAFHAMFYMAYGVESLLAAAPWVGR